MQIRCRHVQDAASLSDSCFLLPRSARPTGWQVPLSLPMAEVGVCRVASAEVLIHQLSAVRKSKGTATAGRHAHQPRHLTDLCKSVSVFFMTN